ncbi:MAG TPA: helix-turn-helix transcriptional regulator [Chthoniobacteraceae bacterium]
MVRSFFSPAHEALRLSLIEERKVAGLTQTELAGRLKKPQPFISAIERGIRRVDLPEFTAIMKALGREPVEAFEAIYRRFPEHIEI